MSDRYSSLLSGYSAVTTWDAVPSETVHEVKRRLLDSIGVAVAGHDEAAAVAARTYAAEFDSPGGATLWGSAFLASPEVAAFANGVAVRCLDFNDTYLSREPLHPSDAIPALAALAEWRGASSRAFITAVAVAYEISVTLCDAASLRARGWDHVNFLAIGVACGAGILLGLSQEQIEWAVSITCVTHAAMRETRAGELSMWKGAAAADASRQAIFASLLASSGMTGPLQPFEGQMGFVRQLLGGQGFDDAVLWRLEDRIPPSRILDTHIKYWPVEYHAQSAVDAALQVPREFAASLASAHVDTFKTAYEIIVEDPEKWDPKTRETADHSLQFIVASALLYGEITRRTFDPERIRDRRTLEFLMNRVTVEEDPELTATYPEGVPTRITVRDEDGEEFVSTATFPRGHAKNPMSDEEVVAKYKANVSERWKPEKTAFVQHLVWDLDAQPGLSELMGALAVDG